MAKTSKPGSPSFLKSQKALAKYLTAAFKTDSAKDAVKAIGTVARAKGLSALARQTRLERVNLHKSLFWSGSLKLAVAMALLDAFDMQLIVTPKRK